MSILSVLKFIVIHNLKIPPRRSIL